MEEEGKSKNLFEQMNVGVLKYLGRLSFRPNAACFLIDSAT